MLALDYEDQEEANDFVGRAINHPVGLVTEGLLHWWYRSDVEDQGGLADEPTGDIPVKAFVEEVVRFEAPLQRTFRFARRTTEIEPGTVIPRFSAVELALCSANRNQPTLDEPENWAPAEGRGVGATFGFGRHVCLGKALALAELREVAALLRETGFQASSIRERSPLGTSTFRRPEAIRLALGPASG